MAERTVSNTLTSVVAENLRSMKIIGSWPTPSIPTVENNRELITCGVRKGWFLRLSTHGEDTNVPTGKYMESHKNYKKVDALDPTELIFPTRILIQLNLFLMFKTGTMGQSSTDLHVTQNHQIWQTLWKTKMAENPIKKNMLFSFSLFKNGPSAIFSMLFHSKLRFFGADFQMPPASPKGRSMGTTSVFFS